MVAGHALACIKHRQWSIRDVSGGGHDYGGIDQDWNEDGARWENDRPQSLAEAGETVWRRGRGYCLFNALWNMSEYEICMTK